MLPASIFFISMICLTMASVVPPSIAEAQSSFQSAKKKKRAPEFVVPSRLRPRVNFWIDIFTKYGKYHSVIHHRTHPQAVFRVLDFSQKAPTMSERQFKKFKDAEVKKQIAEVQAAMKRLAAGKSPQNSLEMRIVKQMSFLPSGTGKYRKVVKEGLIRAQTGIKERYRGAVERSGRYLHILEKIFVEDYGLPIELTRLPFIESSFDYTAYSSVGAAGIWQFMKATARSYMKVNSLIDERRDVISATHGAAKYLQYAYKKLGKWPLALTSYNHGITGVGRKVKKAGTRDIIRLVENPNKQYFGFASQNFWPEFLAALEVYDNLPRYFPGLVPEPPKRIAFLELPHSLSVKTVSKELGLSVDTLKSLNYAVSSRVWNGAYSLPKGYALKVPAAKGPQLNKLRNPRLASKGVTAGGAVHGGIVYRVRRGDTLSRIARKYRTTVSNLRRLNGLRSDLVKVGETLVVRQDVKRSSRTSTATSTATTYRVRRGDNLSSIASRFGTSVSQLKSLNGLRSSAIRAGQLLRVRGESKPRSSSASKGRAQVSSSRAVYHKVRRGDSLYSLARKYGTSVSKIKALNGLQGNSIRIGARLKIKGGTQSKTSQSSGKQMYRVRSGDSLWSISRKFGRSISSIKSANGLRGNSVKIGQKLVIP
jgi:membrane-bound lytic murein transglycosylase D